MNILITGSSGFIGYSLAKSLLKDGHKVIGIDLPYELYNEIQKYRAWDLADNFFENYEYYECDLSLEDEIKNIELSKNVDFIVHLAAKTGVRESLIEPKKYLESNIVAFYNILQLVQKYKLPFIYASSSSVYGGNLDCTDSQKSFYAASKKCNEIMAESYYEMFGLKSIGCRFFTVYGPAGRPDMAVWKFTSKILNNEPIYITSGHVTRDFTYIDDVVTGLKLLIENYDKINNSIVDIGYGQAEFVEKLVDIIEDATGKKAIRKFQSLPLGDVRHTSSKNSLEKINFEPKINLSIGVEKFIKWYKLYDSK